MKLASLKDLDGVAAQLAEYLGRVNAEVLWRKAHGSRLPEGVIANLIHSENRFPKIGRPLYLLRRRQAAHAPPAKKAVVP